MIGLCGMRAVVGPVWSDGGVFKALWHNSLAQGDAENVRWSAQALSTRPGILSGPVTFCGLTPARVFLSDCHCLSILTYVYVIDTDTCFFSYWPINRTLVTSIYSTFTCKKVY